jgi:hypothetical protein
MVQECCKELHEFSDLVSNAMQCHWKQFGTRIDLASINMHCDIEYLVVFNCIYDFHVQYVVGRTPGSVLDAALALLE